MGELFFLCKFSDCVSIVPSEEQYVFAQLISYESMYISWFWLRRTKLEGGQYAGEDEPRFEALLLAMELGAEYVDIEFKVGSVFTSFHSISFDFRIIS
jgi:hypothetical protein